jgi:hypothetical protein
VTAPPTLAAAQALLSGALVRTTAVSQDPDVVRAAEAVVARGVRLSAVQQVEIYREQYWLRHVGAMQEDFATIHALLGDDAFRALCEDYFERYPPASFTLRDLGERLAEHVRIHEPWAKDPLLADCARLEWAFVEAFDAPDAPPLDAVAIAEAPEEAWGGARVVLHPSVQLVEMAHPAHAFRAAVKAEADHLGDDAPPPARPEPSATHVVVYRGPEKLMYIAIEPLAFALLRRLAGGEALAEACEQVAKSADVADPSELEPRVGAWFQAWASYGWVSRVDFNAPPRPE